MNWEKNPGKWEKTPQVLEKDPLGREELGKAPSGSRSGTERREREELWNTGAR